jgi:hypothetical protein
LAERLGAEEISGGAWMKNAVLLAGMWVGIILIAYAIAYVDTTGPAVPVLRGDLLHEDVQGRFVVPVPVGWAVQTESYGMQLVPPVTGLEVWAVGVSADTPEEALDAAFDLVDPCPPCERGETTTVDTEGGDGVTRTSFALGPDNEGRTVSAEVVSRDGESAVLIVRTAESATIPDRVTKDLQRIRDGFALPAAATVVEESSSSPVETVDETAS